MNASHVPDELALEFDAAEPANRLRRGELPIVTTPDPLAPGDHCHYVTPVRFGRRRSDQHGYIHLTSGWLKFRGTLDVSITWGEVAEVQRADREIVVSLEGSPRLLRFSCHSQAEAARGALIARHLAQSAHPRTADPKAKFEHAAL